MTTYTATQRVIDAAEANGYSASYCISNTNFGTSEYVYIRLSMDDQPIKVRISDHGKRFVPRLYPHRVSPARQNVDEGSS